MSDNKNSDTQGMGSLYQRLRKPLMRYVSRYFKKPQEIEDVVQEVFVRVLEAKQRRNTQVNASYLYRATRNLALNTLDKMENKLTDTVGDFESSTVLFESSLLEDDFESRERFELFCRAVRQLPLKCQRVFILRRVYGLSQKEIAQRLGISIKTVEVHMSKAIVRCTDYMDAHEQANPAENVAHHDVQGRR